MRSQPVWIPMDPWMQEDINRKSIEIMIYYTMKVTGGRGGLDRNEQEHFSSDRNRAGRKLDCLWQVLKKSQRCPVLQKARYPDI